MRDPLTFWPSLSQRDGASVDREVRGALAGSLKTVFARASDQVAVDDSRLETLLRRIEQGPIRPAVFGLYSDLVESLLAEDGGALQTLSRQLLDLDAPGEGTRIVSLSDADLGPGQAERYVRLVDDDPEHRYNIKPLNGRYQEAEARVSAGLGLLDQGAPELAEEIRGLVREIVLVTDGSEPTTHYSFDGASTFYLWGALLINVRDSTRLDLAQQIAHEAAHLLLFGLMMGQPLTENNLEERFASPLRQDARPMEGVVHATYVLARMSYTLERLLESDVLSGEEQDTARRTLANHRARFFDTLPLIQRHARFRPGSDVIFRGAVDYMSREQAEVA